MFPTWDTRESLLASAESLVSTPLSPRYSASLDVSQDLYGWTHVGVPILLDKLLEVLAICWSGVWDVVSQRAIVQVRSRAICYARLLSSEMARP